MVRGHDDAFEGPGVKRSQEDSQQLTSDKNVERMRETSGPGTPKYPSDIKLTFIFVALCLTVFLVALVCSAYLLHLCNSLRRLYRIANTNALKGSNYHCYRSPDHHVPISQRRRYWMVRQCISPHDLQLPTSFREALYLAIPKMDIYWCRLDLRSRLCHLWRESQLRRPHNRTSHCRNWRRGHLLRRINHHCQVGPPSEEACVYRNHWRCMGHSERGRSPSRGCFHKSVLFSFKFTPYQIWC